MDLMQQRKLFTNLTSKQIEIIEYYHENNMAMLKKICDPIIYRKNVTSGDYDELYGVASDTLLESLVSYDDTKECQFHTYLTGNIKRAFYDWTRDRLRGKRCNLARDEDGKIKKDKNGMPIVIPNIPLDEPMEDGINLCEKIASDFNLESAVVDEMGISGDEKVEKYLCSLSKLQRQIVEMKMNEISVGEIKASLGLTEKAYSDNLEAIRQNRLITMFSKNKNDWNYEKAEGNEMVENSVNPDLVMDIDTTDSYRTDKSTMYSLLDDKKFGYLDCHYISQRQPFQWDEEQVNKYYSRILNNQPVPEIVICEMASQNEKISYLVEGLQRISYAEEFKENRLPVKAKGAEFTNIKYKRYELDEDGNKVFDSNGRPKFVIDTYDIVGKYYKDLPEFLQKRFNNFNITVTRFFNCTPEMIDYHIRNYNNHTAMTKSQYGITSVSNTTSGQIKALSEQHPFFKDNIKCSNKSRKKGVLDEVVARCVMATYFIQDWKKGAIDAYKFVDEHAKTEQFEELREVLDKLSNLADNTMQALFNTTNTHIWVAAFRDFLAMGLPDEKFVDFIKAFQDSLHRKVIGEKSYDSVNTRNSKDKTTVVNKLEMIKTLMADYFSVKVVPEEPVSIADFVRENVNSEIIDDDIEQYMEVLDMLTLDVDNTSKLMEERNRPSFVALVAYAFEEEINLDGWIKDYFKKNTTYIKNQKENYLHMKTELDKYSAAEEAA